MHLGSWLLGCLLGGSESPRRSARGHSGGGGRRRFLRLSQPQALWGGGGVGFRGLLVGPCEPRWCPCLGTAPEALRGGGAHCETAEYPREVLGLRVIAFSSLKPRLGRVGVPLPGLSGSVAWGPSGSRLT
ncbi:hypothetical protein EGR_08758 [Echinococcus granulosus]|uniref:Uncharacterized protein n=1 Tax=Echinococcus granulosus TaxID=6210 RepID=W6U5E0_ECHGR|nr:hypothetical protein EGR_08758 [Echinococcus granulosus]EUB56388.1 hypothetical protein EGR_08758 [Echinococcus granulosus]